MTCRKDYRDLTITEREIFVSAMKHLKSTGVIESYAIAHDDQFGVAHGGSSFLPWHREFLRRFEDELRSYDPSISIPFWNQMDDNTPDTLLWSEGFLGQFDTLWSLGRDLGSATLPDAAEVINILNNASYSQFHGPLEGIHDDGHDWACSFGEMISTFSPRDPVFYLHHCYIDMLWGQWQLIHHDAEFEASGGEDGGNIDQAMPPWLTTPGDMLDYRVINSYDYPLGFLRDQPIVTLNTPVVNFNSIPEGEPAMRAIVFDLDSCDEVHFSVISGPTLVSGPADSEFDILYMNITGNPDIDIKARFWLTFEGTNNGDEAEGTVTIECEETGETFIISITADTVHRPSSATVLVLDQSNSMNSSSGFSTGETRSEVLQFSAPPFVDVIQDNNGIGVCYFDHDPYPGIDVTPATVLGKLQANASISDYAPNPSGWTSIGEAVAFAHQLLDDAPDDYDIQAMVVLTDGKENHGGFDRRYISEVADSIDDRVYAIGLGSVANIEPTALNALCNGNDGYLLMTGALNEDAYFRLAKYYQQILAGVSSEEVVLDPDGWIKPGQKQRIAFWLNEGDLTADVVLLSTDPRFISFSLEAPNGDIITPATTAVVPALEFNGSNTVSYYRVSLPVPSDTGSVPSGKWHAILEVDCKLYKRYLSSLKNNSPLYRQIAAHGFRYSLSVKAYSILRMRARLSQSSNEPGAQLNLRASLTEYGRAVSNRARIQAEVIRPDNTKTILKLVETEAGIFEASIPDAAAGIYQFRVMASGKTMRGIPFTREQLLSGATWIGGDQPPPSHQNDPDTENNRLCRLLDCLFKQKGLHELLEKNGIDLKKLRKCLKKICEGRLPAGSKKSSSLNSKLSSVIKDKALLKQLVQVVRTFEKDDCS